MQRSVRVLLQKGLVECPAKSGTFVGSPSPLHGATPWGMRAEKKRFSKRFTFVIH
jgi:hypothetical protein